MDRSLRRLVLSTLATPVVTACGTGEQPADAPPDPAPPVVAVTARDYAFESADTINSGWTTFRLVNEGAEPHFIFLTRLPDSVAFARYGAEVGAAFGMAWDGLQSGALDKAGAGALLGERLPAWYATASVRGGPGILSPGRATETTVHLAPGTYVMECYLKTADGQFHIALGMMRPLVVRADSNLAVPPTADATLRVSNAGLDAPDRLTPGRHVVAVTFAEHPQYGLGNDVHVARLPDGVEPAEVVGWMDWMDRGGLAAPAPAEFVGGAEEGPVGTTAYMHLTLEPGRHVWVTETDPSRGMVHPFVVE